MVDKDRDGFFKMVQGQRFPVEKGLVKRLYKIPDLKGNTDLAAICRYIIFPYTKGTSGFEIISEEKLKVDYPDTFAYLLHQKAIFDKRDKGKPNPVASAMLKIS